MSEKGIAGLGAQERKFLAWLWLEYKQQRPGFRDEEKKAREEFDSKGLRYKNANYLGGGLDNKARAGQSQLCRGLEARGFIILFPKTGTKKKVTHIRLTSTGLQAGEHYYRHGGYSPAEIKQAADAITWRERDSLQKCNRALEEMRGQAGLKEMQELNALSVELTRGITQRQREFRDHLAQRSPDVVKLEIEFALEHKMFLQMPVFTDTSHLASEDDDGDMQK